MRLGKTACITENAPEWNVPARWAILPIAVVTVCLSVTGLEQALSGRVLDEAGGPIPGASVYVHKLSGDAYDTSVKVGLRGEFSFDELPDGDYLVRATAAGFVSVSYEPLRVRFPNQVHRSFVLMVEDVDSGDGVYSASEVVGELVLRGRRLAAATICLTPIDTKNRPACTATNPLGQYFLAVQPGEYTVGVASAEGLKSEYHLDLRKVGEYRDLVRLGN